MSEHDEIRAAIEAGDYEEATRLCNLAGVDPNTYPELRGPRMESCGCGGEHQ